MVLYETSFQLRHSVLYITAIDKIQSKYSEYLCALLLKNASSAAVGVTDSSYSSNIRQMAYYSRMFSFINFFQKAMKDNDTKKYLVYILK